MTRALALAKRGLYSVPPNPMVGAVLVVEGRVVGEGWHRHAGGPHAEVEALARWRRRRGPATLYVTLEPCVHQGRTPTCVDAILSAPIERVVLASKDPDPRVNGRGIAYLRKAGLRVEAGLMSAEAAFLNRAFFRSKTVGLPYVIMKSAMTLDGRIADLSGRSFWITREPARRQGQLLREEVDAIIVGSRTALADDPRLDRLREHPPRGPLLKVLLDPDARVRPGARLFKTGRVLWVVERSAKVACVPSSASMLRLPAAGGKFPLNALMRRLASEGVQSALIEGGGETAGRFLGAGLVQEAALFFGMKMLGEGVSGLSGFSRTLGDAFEVRPFAVRRPGGDLFIRGMVCSRD